MNPFPYSFSLKHFIVKLTLLAYRNKALPPHSALNLGIYLLDLHRIYTGKTHPSVKKTL